MNLTVAVIAKECLPGRAKTRLSPPLSSEVAAVLAQISLSQTLETVRTVPAARRMLVFEGTPRGADAAGFDVVPQCGGGLDERLAAICALVSGPLLIVGMDSPQLAVADLAPLLQDWSGAEPGCGAWLGPAVDGGFWALGLHRPDGRLISGVPMSTSHTAADQRGRLEQAGLAVGLLAAMTDVDHFEDAVDAAKSCPGTPFARAVQDLARELRAGMPSPTVLAAPTVLAGLR